MAVPPRPRTHHHWSPRDTKRWSHRISSSPSLDKTCLFPPLDKDTDQWWMAHGSPPVFTLVTCPFSPAHLSLGHFARRLTGHRSMSLASAGLTSNCSPPGSVSLARWRRRAPCGDILLPPTPRLSSLIPQDAWGASIHGGCFSPSMEDVSPHPQITAQTLSGAGSLLPCPLQCHPQSWGQATEPGEAAAKQQRMKKGIKSHKTFPIPLEPGAAPGTIAAPR